MAKTENHQKFISLVVKHGKRLSRKQNLGLKKLRLI